MAGGSGTVRRGAWWGARAIVSPLGSAALDTIGPIGFLVLVLAISIQMLTAEGTVFAERSR